MLQRAVAEGVAPAIQLVVHKDGDVVFDAAFGTAGRGEPLQRHHVFDLASLTKLWTTLAFAELWRLGLDHLDHRIEGAPPHVSVKSILRHDAGYPAHRRFDRELGQIRPGTYAAYERVVDLCRQTPTATDGRVRYSDLGFILLGERIERLSGRTLASWFETEEGLVAFDRRRGPRRVPGHVVPTKMGNSGFVHDDNARAMGGVAGHAGLFGAAYRVAAWAQRALDAYAGTESPGFVPDIIQRLWDEPGPRGLGFDRATPGGTAPGWSRRAVGHLGFTGTSLWIEPEQRLIAVLLSNRVLGRFGPDAIRSLRRRIHGEVLRRWGVPPLL